MASISDLRTALQARLRTIDGLRVYDVMPARPEPPAAAVHPRRGSFNETFDGAVLHGFEVVLYINAADTDRAQRSIDLYLAPDGPIVQAVDADPSLGGVADSARVTGYDDYARMLSEGGAEMLVAMLNVEVLA